MASIIYSDAGSSVGTDALFGRGDSNTKAYIGQQLNQYVSAISDGASNLAGYVMDRYNSITNANYLAKIDAMRTRVNALWNADVITHLNDLASIQNAGPIMQRWVMAQPTVRAKYLEGYAEGYDGTASMDGGVGPNHYDYRRVMHGVVDTKSRKANNYYERIVSGNDILSTLEKNLIINTWDVIEDNIAEGINTDCTSVWNGTW